jgi:multidrug efflux pump subunit AcrB
VDSVVVTLSEVGNITKKTTGVDIQKENQSYRVSVCFDYVGSFTLANKTIEDAIDYMNSSVLPVGFKAYDEYKSWQNVPKERYFWLILLIVAAIFAMLTISFESLRNALAVILMIPVSYIGVFLTFGLTNFSFDQGGFAAFVMLSGIVVNAGIYLVSTYKRFCGTDDTGQKAPSRQYIKAFNHKVIPISLTILSTVLGLLPFMTDGPDEVFWFDFAIGTIGGLLFSAIAIVLFLPVFLLKKRR